MANLMVFYRGALSYTELQNMPLPEMLRLQKYAVNINEERKREAAKNGI